MWEKSANLEGGASSGEEGNKSLGGSSCHSGLSHVSSHGELSGGISSGKISLWEAECLWNLLAIYSVFIHLNSIVMLYSYGLTDSRFYIYSFYFPMWNSVLFMSQEEVLYSLSLFALTMGLSLIL